MTDRYAVIGHPVAHSRSPWIHARFAEATGQAMRYDRVEAPLDGFAHTVRTFRAGGGRGANVTVPFKEEAFGLCARTSARAQQARAVNTLVLGTDEIYGDNTDGAGLVRDLEVNLGFALEGARLLLMGAGGAARGVIGPLRAAGVARVVIANRTPQRAETLAARFPGVRGCGYDALGAEAFDLVVNATSAGLDGALPPVPAAVFGSGALAYDMVYGRETPFMALARRCGVRVADGAGMLVEQAAEAFLLWRGVRPETAAVLAALRAA